MDLLVLWIVLVGVHFVAWLLFAFLVGPAAATIVAATAAMAELVFWQRQRIVGTVNRLAADVSAATRAKSKARAISVMQRAEEATNDLIILPDDNEEERLGLQLIEVDGAERANATQPIPDVRKDDGCYHEQGEPWWIRRFDQDWPEGIGARVFSLVGDDMDGIRVAGITKYPACEVAAKFVEGYRRRVELVRRPDNPRDRYAIAVIGHWQDRQGKQYSGQIGWVPKDYAKTIGTDYPPDMPLGARLLTIYFERDDENKSLGIRIDIGRPKAKRSRRNKKPGR